MEYIQIMGIKTCDSCKKFLLMSNFGKDKLQIDGLKKICKACRSAAEKKYREKDIELFRKKRAIYRENNREALRIIGKKANKKYYKNNKGKRQEWVIKNREHVKEYKNKYFQENKEKVMNKFYMKKYGITLEEKLNMLKKQKYSCNICNVELLNSRVSFVDHDHETGKVRGILCNTCNRALGMFRDDIKVLESAIEYLIKNAKP